MREQKRTVRLTRNRDGSLRPVNNDPKTDELKSVWGKQSAQIEITPTSLKQDFKDLFKSIKKPNQKAKNGGSKTLTGQQKQLSHNNSTGQKTYTINISVPSLAGLKKLMAKVPKKPAIVILGLAIIVGIGVVFWPIGGDKTKDKTSQNQKVAGQIEYKVTPEFAVMSPGGGGVDNLGGYALISPKGAPKVYAYVDTIGGVPVKVSQQKLPDSIGQDAQKLADLASQFNANEEVEVDDRKAYIGTSVDGPQSVIFAREDIMVLVVSDQQISNKEWVEYLGDLRF